MIFISYNHKDKEIVSDIASKLAIVFGRESVFYDEWSIQPGDDIIDKMNQGLETMSYFFFFMSRNSLTSEMVKLEWQNALFMKAQKKIKFIPVKLDDCNVPAILLQNLYINIYGQGLEYGLRQMIDVVSGISTNNIVNTKYHNVRATANISSDKKEIKIEISAQTYFEPSPQFFVLHGNKNEDIRFKLSSNGMYYSGQHDNIKLNNGTTHNAFFAGFDKGLNPGYPIRFEMKSDNQIDFHGIMKSFKENEYEMIPTNMITE
jgi:hypothetical protein